MNKQGKKKGALGLGAKINLVILIFVIVLVGYLIAKDPGDISSEPYGAGDYYYTDVENFEEIFFREGDYLKDTSLWYMLILFVGWGLCCWYFLKWIDKRR